ncbi:uncharacterized protein LOC117123132 [Anneissia japonica]|uniref:uncharacterized protein LOC117123132 n=1 Tax=Anneissia japonica TaxID=1529436 RepID=UPI0014257069|nr:uncharacterized protein LOC117123132 [Anneissia japonica]
MMAKAIVEEFPSLKDEEGQGFEAWYTAGRGKHSSSGWIEERLRNVRRSYAKNPSTPIAASSTTKLVSASLPESDDLTTEEFHKMVEWLKHNIAPASQITLFMKKTAAKRAEWIRANPGQPFNNIMTEYPRLFDMPGMVSILFGWFVIFKCFHFICHSSLYFSHQL